MIHPSRGGSPTWHGTRTRLDVLRRRLQLQRHLQGGEAAVSHAQGDALLGGQILSAFEARNGAFRGAGWMSAILGWRLVGHELPLLIDQHVNPGLSPLHLKLECHCRA